MIWPSAFIDLAAVEAWDAWFRWRQHDELRDVSIQDTWTRVAHALAGAESPEQAGAFELRLFEAMEGWRLLLDERVLATAGTDRPDWPDDDLVAVVNLASLVREPGQAEACLDHAGLESTAELAVVALDNAAALAVPRIGPPAMHLRIGLIGLADAMVLLGYRYDSSDSRRLAREVARGLAHGCLRGSLRLARERGARARLDEHPALGDKLRGMSADMAAEAAASGVRHARLTAITSQPRLAQLANHVSDAIDPLAVRDDAPAAPGAPTRLPGSPGFALEILRRQGLSTSQLNASMTDATASTQAQVELRVAMQAWIDHPIAYPLPAHGAPGQRVPLDS
ncbi:hypothetical protein [Dyella sedimenti]|uniref:hypothetical protein n=1 Tax=Dyella sedimenti TaxID=2919947 RepID=UPI001FA98DC5|nr:hypothetical protein [Dyella sedimenti]